MPEVTSFSNILETATLEELWTELSKRVNGGIFIAEIPVPSLNDRPKASMSICWKGSIIHAYGLLKFGLHKVERNLHEAYD